MQESILRGVPIKDINRKKEDLVRELKDLREQLTQLQTNMGTAELCLRHESTMIKGIESCLDITAHKDTEGAPQDSVGMLRGILRAAPIGIGIVTNRILGWTNDYITNLLGYSSEELVGQSARILYESDEEFQRVALVKHPQVEQYGVGSVETRFRKKDGAVIDVLLSSASIVQGDMAQGLMFTVLDITEKKKAEREIAESEERYKRITAAVTDYIYTVRVADGKPVETEHSPACVAVTGYSPDDFARDPYLWFTMVHEEDRQAVQDQAALVLTGNIYPVEHRIIRKDGSMRWVRNTPVPHYDEHGLLIAFDGLVQDITERKVAEERTRQSEEKYRNIFENAIEGIFQSTPGGRFLSANPALARFYGYDSPQELIETITDIGRQLCVNPETRREFVDRLEKYGFIEGFESERYKKDGTTMWTSINARAVKGTDGKTLYYEGTAMDITDRKRSEAEKEKLKEQLAQSQKMEAIGTLAGGIAHDFNNLLMGIQGYTSLMLLDIEESHPFHGRLKSIEQQVQSGAELTKQLLGFARGGKYEIVPTNLNELVSRSLDMFGRTKKEIVIQKRLAGDLYTVDVDRSQIEQVLLNLLVNAWHAMPAGGELYVETQNVNIYPGYARMHMIDPGQYIRLSVTDTGVGMNEATKQRIFEPFFTTKEMGRGTGLGLASAYGIIRSHRGTIKVYSEEGKGTTFNIYLPASERAPAADRKKSGTLLKGNETILLIDDQGPILKVAADMLQSLGYKVITTQNGNEAITCYAEKQDAIDLVILDMIMPGLSGAETFERLREIRHDVRVLLSSGYSLNGQAIRILERGCRGFIQKPFNIYELSQKIREILDS